MPARPAQGGENLNVRIAELEAEIGRHQVVQQQLARAKVLLDGELQRFTVIQQYVQKAALADDLETFYQLTIESVVEAFEFEAALITRSEEDPARQRVAASFGFEDAFVDQYLTLEEG